MRRIIITAALLAALPGVAAAQYGGYRPYTYSPPSYSPPKPPQTSYDWTTGNSYTTTYGSDGSSRTSGFNTQTGTMWNSQTDRNGRTSGMDGNGNYWTYDNNSKTYMNLGTGEMCVGEGYARICN